MYIYISSVVVVGRRSSVVVCRRLSSVVCRNLSGYTKQFGSSWGRGGVNSPNRAAEWGSRLY